MRFEKIHEVTYRDFGFELVSVEPGSVANGSPQSKRRLLRAKPGGSRES